MPERLALAAMGTRFELVLHGGESSFLRAAGEEALALIAEDDQRLNLFRRDSLVARLNESQGQPVRVDSEFLELLDLCREVHEATDGAFDPTVGGHMHALGFREGKPAKGGTVAPADFARVQWSHETRHVVLPDDLQLDLGAIGKGWALDRAWDCLKDHSIPAALLHGGTSTVIGVGAPPETAGWPIAIELPAGTAGDRPTVVLCDQALSVSAGHGRVAASGATHVIDPATGMPLAGTAVAAVVANRAAKADAFSTAALVLGKVPDRAALDWAQVFPSTAPTTTP